MHRDLVPNAHVRRLLLTEFQRDHENLKAMMQKIRLRREVQKNGNTSSKGEGR